MSERIQVMPPQGDRKKIRVSTILSRKKKGRKLAMLTAYDYYTARLLDQAGIEILLVGDSAAMVVHGHENTLPITLETMLDHTAAVCRGREYAFVITDMPFMSYQASHEQAITNAGRCIKEAGAEAVKLEGGQETVDTVAAVIKAGIPVMAHIGLSYQQIHAQSGARVQGRDDRARSYLIDSAIALEQAGAFSMILEMIQEDVAAEITHRLTIPTIGIGSGKGCDGQVLVTNDILGLYDRLKPRFVREYADLTPIIIDAARSFRDDVL
ncbi:MAG: 3-methyl-2-oxobutanoate hydroxymethyltransferase, partial [Candidatus Zixiibacteriota bacterium]